MWDHDSQPVFSINIRYLALIQLGRGEVMTFVLYQIRRRIHLTLHETGGSRNWNLPMNPCDFVIFNAVHNELEFWIKNTDRKPIDMTGRSATMILYDHRTQQRLLDLPLTLVDGPAGRVRMTLTPDAIADWELQSYSYQVSVTNADGREFLLYVDQNQLQRGFFEIKQGPEVLPRDSVKILWNSLTPIEEEENQQPTIYYTSGAFPGSIQFKNTSGLHSVVAQLENFTGRLVIQGSVEISPPTDIDWFQIETHTYNRQTSTEAYSFQANLNWIRFKIFNQWPPGDPDALPSDIGIVKQIELRS